MFSCPSFESPCIGGGPPTAIKSPAVLENVPIGGVGLLEIFLRPTGVGDGDLLDLWYGNGDCDLDLLLLLLPLGGVGENDLDLRLCTGDLEIDLDLDGDLEGDLDLDLDGDLDLDLEGDLDLDLPLRILSSLSISFS